MRTIPQISPQGPPDGFPASAGKPAGGWISDFGAAVPGCSVFNRVYSENDDFGLPVSGRRFWDVPFLRKVYHESDDLGFPAIQGFSDGFPASADRVSRRQDFRFRAGGFGMLRL